MKRPLLVSFDAAKVRILFELPNISQGFFEVVLIYPILYGIKYFAFSFAQAN